MNENPAYVCICGIFLYLCAVNDANKQKHGSQSISYIGF